MLMWSLTFFLVAIVAAIFGFTEIAVGAVGIARLLFFLFVVLFVISIVVHGMRTAFKGEPPV